jgi:hypothetical protein
MEANIMRNLKKTLALLVSVVMILGLFNMAAMASTPTAAASAGSNIEATRGTALTTPVDITIELTDDKFSPAIADGANLAAWITNLPAGMTAVAKGAIANETTTAVIAVGGTPTALVASVAIAISIPAAALETSTAALEANWATPRNFIVSAPERASGIAELDIGTEVLSVTRPSGTAGNAYFRFIRDGAQDKGRWTELTIAGDNTAARSNTVSVSNLLKANQGKIQVVIAAAAPTNNDTGETAQQIFVAGRPARPAAPAIFDFIDFDDSDREEFAQQVRLTGAPDTMEMRPLNRIEWEGCVGGVPAATNNLGTKIEVMRAQQTWQFRTKAVGTESNPGSPARTGATKELELVPGSVAVNFRVPAYTRTPAPRVNYARSVISLNVNWEFYDEDADAWRGIAERNVALGADILPAPPSGGWTTAGPTAITQLGVDEGYLVRVKATDKRPASLPAYVWIEAGAAFDVDSIGTGVDYFARLTRNGPVTGFVPAQGMLFEWFNSANSKWARGLPKGIEFAATRVRLAGNASQPASDPIWIRPGAGGILQAADGDGTATAPTAGWETLTLLLGPTVYDCDTCKDSGKVNCAACDGTGKIDCDNHNSTGQACAVCGADEDEPEGKIDCKVVGCTNGKVDCTSCS